MLVSLFLILFGSLMIYAGVQLLKRINKVKKWSLVDATLTKRGVKYSDKPTGSLSARYEIDIEYTYTFKHKTFKGTTFSAIHELMTKSAAQKKVDALPETFQVYVNPENPSEAYYKISSKLLGYVVLGVGILCLAIFPIVWFSS